MKISFITKLSRFPHLDNFPFNHHLSGTNSRIANGDSLEVSDTFTAKALFHWERPITHQIGKTHQHGLGRPHRKPQTKQHTGLPQQDISLDSIYLLLHCLLEGHQSVFWCQLQGKKSNERWVVSRNIYDMVSMRFRDTRSQTNCVLQITPEYQRSPGRIASYWSLKTTSAFASTDGLSQKG